jgi:thioredoxin-like negative regulator of GroEL
MLERIVVALGLIVLGLIAYQVLLAVQRHWAANGSRRNVAAGRATLLVFTSPTCAPCKLQQLPIVKRLMTDWSDRIDLRVIDVTEQPDLAAQFGVWSLPTTIVLDARQQVAAINQGVANEYKLREQFTRVSRSNPRRLTKQPMAG